MRGISRFTLASRIWLGVPCLIVLAVVVTLAMERGPSSAIGNGQTVGLFQHEAESFDGYTLFEQLQDSTAYLIDNDGRLVHSWPGSYGVMGLYLEEDGGLLSTRILPNPGGFPGGHTGRVERRAWD